MTHHFPQFFASVPNPYQAPAEFPMPNSFSINWRGHTIRSPIGRFVAMVLGAALSALFVPPLIVLAIILCAPRFAGELALIPLHFLLLAVGCDGFVIVDNKGAPDFEISRYAFRRS